MSPCVFGMSKRFWDFYPSWEEAEAAWDERSTQASAQVSLKAPVALPTIPPMVAEGSMRWNGIRYLVRKTGVRRLFDLFISHPIRYTWCFLRSVMSSQPYRQEDDLFFFGVRCEEELLALMARSDVLLVVGMSYCQKPIECPGGRFSGECSADLDNPICRQCLIGKSLHALPREKTVVTVIPTINEIGTHILDIIHAFPSHQILFVISACQMALEMFKDFGNMVGIKGVGIRLGGRVCTTMHAFILSEQGVKPGLTVVRPSAQRRLFSLLRHWRTVRQQECGSADQGKECGGEVRP